MLGFFLSKTVMVAPNGSSLLLVFRRRLGTGAALAGRKTSQGSTTNLGLSVQCAAFEPESLTLSDEPVEDCEGKTRS